MHEMRERYGELPPFDVVLKTYTEGSRELQCPVCSANFKMEAGTIAAHSVDNLQDPICFRCAFKRDPILTKIAMLSVQAIEYTKEMYDNFPESAGRWRAE